MKYNWKIKEVDLQKVQQLNKEQNIPSVISAVLINRGLDNPVVINKFFNPSIDNLYNPFLMSDMDKAVNRLKKAISNKEKIVILGDYDVDGTTATAFLYLFLQEIGLEVSYYIPDREKEGYGVSNRGIDFAIKSSANLIITCDCGINSINEIEYANKNNIDIIVTDHHEPAEVLPDALAVLDPKRKDDIYPFKELCGIGVAFKMLYGLSIANRIPLEKIFYYLDLVAIGTAADIVPILSENRIIVSKGLKILNKSKNIGLQSLLKVSGFENKTINVVNIVFGLAPRINAAGRLGEAIRAVRLLTSFNHKESIDLSNLLERENRNRQIIEKATIDNAILQLNATHDLDVDKILILDAPDWHQGVIGIVASKLKEIYNRPVVMLTFQNGIGKGSARSIPGFNIFSAFSECSNFLLNFGGHKMAAGLTIKKESLPHFKECLKKIASDQISDEMLNRVLSIEGEIPFSDINQKTIDYLQKMAPFGPGNMRPIFVARNLKISGIPRIVGENHLKFKACQDRIVISAIGWKLSELYEMLISNRPLDMAFVIEENEWNGLKEIQLNIKDIHYSVTNHN
ncbi:MAG: single-stranded-DNA-specific exonuclease RecJ [Candidatus Marinimicrobia bacterium]|nr:single-stranded-DNA-specific exonuclease RecJ [Candidatus Neomarinimicrobiota bacterium]